MAATRPVVTVALGGPQAVGKSSTLRALTALRPDIAVIFLGEQFAADFADQSPAERARIRAQVTARVAPRLARRDTVTIVDLHYLDLREPDPRIQDAALLARFDLLAFLTLPPEALLERRHSDADRADRPAGLAEAVRDIDAHLAYARELANRNVATVLLDGRHRPTQVARQLLQHIETAQSHQDHSRIGK